ncbi:MAG: hypothetical protein J6S67_24685 [Methanobrevibacter sp.]|nr:hypothetical protein [Methanobrevibacter sp.]
MSALLSQFMNKYPYTDFHELNADWLIKTLMEMINQVENFVSLNAIKYADPIQWNIVSQYEKNTVVIDPLTGTAYISVQPVPSGVALTRTEYWTVVFDLGSFVVRAAKNFSNRYEVETTLTATFASSQGDWLVWGDTLYEALVNITAGDQYVVDSNVKHITMEEVVDALVQAIDAIDTKVGDLDDLTTSVTTSVVLAINSVLDDLGNKIGDLDNLNTTDKTNLVNSINELFNNKAWVSSADFGLVGDGVTDDSPAFIQMLAYAKDNNKSIKLESNKIFALDNVIYIPSYTYIDGSNATIKWTNASSVGFQCHGEYPSPDNINPSPDSEQATGYNGHHDIVIKNLIFDSQSPNVQRSCSIVLFHSKNVVIENCTFLNDTLNHAIECNSSQHIIINNCSFKDNIAGNDVTRTEINIDYANSSGLPGFGTNSATYDYTICNDITITNCLFDSVMSCFDSHGTTVRDGAILTPVDGIIIDNIIARNCEIITTMQSWTNFLISNIFAIDLRGSIDNSFLRLRNVRSGSIKNVTIEHPLNILGTNANIISIGESTVDGITERSHDVTIDNLTALCEDTDLFRLVYLRGATNCNFNNLFIAKTGTSYLIASDPSAASYNIVFNNIVVNQKCNGVINNLSNSSITIKNSYFSGNTEIGYNAGNLKIIDCRVSNLTINNINSYTASNVQLLNHKSDNVIIDAAYNGGGAVTAGNYIDITVTFNESQFYVAPRVLVSPFGGNRSGMRYSVTTITTTNFVVRCYNESASDYSDCPFIWLAIRDSNDT